MSQNKRWPVTIEGIVESVVTTQSSDGSWAIAALGLHKPKQSRGKVTARTWGNTRTAQNLKRLPNAYVHFTADPVTFVDAALGRISTQEPLIERSIAWSFVEAIPSAHGQTDGTQWTEWELTPLETALKDRVVPAYSRAFGAIVEMTIAVSRLDVPAYDTHELYDRLNQFEETVHRCGGHRARIALDRIAEYSDWEVDISNEQQQTQPAGQDG